MCGKVELILVRIFGSLGSVLFQPLAKVEMRSSTAVTGHAGHRSPLRSGGGGGESRPPRAPPPAAAAAPARRPSWKPQQLISDLPHFTLKEDSRTKGSALLYVKLEHNAVVSVVS